MSIFFERSENEKYKIYKLKRPVLWYGLFIISFFLMFSGVCLSGILSLAGFLLLILIVLMGGIEGGLFKDDVKVAKLRGKEVILKGKAFSTKEPIERWIEK